MTLIETARLRLRPRVREDIEPIVIMDSDPEVRRFMGGPLDPDNHRKEVLANIACGRAQHWAWAIERQNRTGFLGMCLLRPWRALPSFASAGDCCVSIGAKASQVRPRMPSSTKRCAS